MGGGGRRKRLLGESSKKSVEVCAKTNHHMDCPNQEKVQAHLFMIEQLQTEACNKSNMG